jgi:hypothetical protein
MTSTESTSTESTAIEAASTEITSTDQAFSSATVEPTVETATQPAAEATSTPTAEAVALAAPGAITSSAVVENAGTEDTTTSVEGALPVIRIAQGSTLLLTVVLASLWWRSRSPRRSRKS